MKLPRSVGGPHFLSSLSSIVMSIHAHAKWCRAVNEGVLMQRVEGDQGLIQLSSVCILYPLSVCNLNYHILRPIDSSLKILTALIEDLVLC